jgi:hypothetical protein|tara:strand:- start:410 stop:724 length:315 start_codon:yes stop_codon:yes gene_type:complete
MLEDQPQGQKPLKIIGQDSVLGLTLKSLVTIAITIATVVGMYYNLQNQITEARELPKPIPPDVTRMEYDMKDQLVRQTIMSTKDDVEELKQRLIRMEDKIDDLR